MDTKREWLDASLGTIHSLRGQVYETNERLGLRPGESFRRARVGCVTIVVPRGRLARKREKRRMQKLYGEALGFRRAGR